MKKLFSISMPLCLAIVLLSGTAGCSLFGPEPERIVLPGVIAAETASSRADGQSHQTDGQSQDHAEVHIAGHIVSVPRSLPLPPSIGELYQGTVEVRAGVPFDVTVKTLGARLCYEAAESTVILGPSRAVIYVFDSLREIFFTEPDVACQLLMGLIPRTDTIVFSEAGEAEIVIRGIFSVFVVSEPGGWMGSMEPRSYELRFPVIVTE